MLDMMRRGAQGVFAKLLFGLLILAFGLWGIPHNFLAGSANNIATVGSTPISMDRFRRAFDNQLKSMSTESTGRINREQAIAIGVDRGVAERLVGQTALQEQAAKMKLALSDETLAEGLQNDPMFQGVDGKFSRLGYDGFLQQLGLTEQGFFALRREDELRRQITDTLTAATVVPKAMIDFNHALEEETRKTEHFIIDVVKKVVVADPDEAKIKETYEANKARFMTPEYRKLAILSLTTDDLKKNIQVSDDDIKKTYEETKATYEKPEKRRIQQIAFKDKAAAEAARKELVDGKKNFLDVAKEAGAKESDVNLGLLTEKQLVDPAIAKAAFSLERDAISEPVDGKFAVVLLRVIEIDAGKKSTFEDAKDLVKEAMITKKANEQLQEKVDLVEEARNAGKTLKEAGESLQLTFKDLEAVSADNKTPDGKTALDMTDAATVLSSAFAAPIGAQNDVLKLPSGGYAWFDTLSSTPPREKTFDEAKGLAKDFYVDTEQQKQLNELAAKLAERLKNGEDAAKLAEEAGGKLEVTDNVKRMISVPGMSLEAIKLAFTLPKGGAAHSESADGKSRVVFRVTDIIPAAAPTAEQSKKLSEKLRGELETDQLIAFVEGLKDKFGVTMNDKLLAKFAGTDTQQ